VDVKARNRMRIVENKALRRLFGTKREEATPEWRKVHKDMSYDISSSPNIMIELRRVRLAGCRSR
jgi:hypothetical protein